MQNGPGQAAFLPLLHLSSSVHLIPGVWQKAGLSDNAPTPPSLSVPTGTVTDPFSPLSSAALTAVTQLSGLHCDGQKHRYTLAPPCESQRQFYAKQP